MIDNCGSYPLKKPRNMFNLQALGNISYSSCEYSTTGKCGDWDFTTLDGRLYSANKIASLVAMYLSIPSIRQDDCGTQYTGGWWADKFRGESFKSGTQLFDLHDTRATRENILKAKMFIQEALKPLEVFINAKINVSTTMVGGGLLTSTITVQGTTSRLTGSYLDKNWIWENN